MSTSDFLTLSMKFFHRVFDLILSKYLDDKQPWIHMPNSKIEKKHENWLHWISSSGYEWKRIENFRGKWESLVYCFKNLECYHKKRVNGKGLQTFSPKFSNLFLLLINTLKVKTSTFGILIIELTGITILQFIFMKKKIHE